MNYPLKLQVALTQVCIDINNAKDINDIDRLAELSELSELSELFEKNGYAFPLWIKIWMQLLKDDPLLNAEEHFKKPKVKSSAFDGMSSSWYIHNNNLEIIKVESAITAICCDPHAAQRSALFAIAAVILSDAIDNNYLGFEWHSRTDEMQSLTNKHNFAIFVEILQRESNFWQEGNKTKNNPPPKAKLHPSSTQQSI
jgi:hypothetical protein